MSLCRLFYGSVQVFNLRIILLNNGSSAWRALRGVCERLRGRGHDDHLCHKLVRTIQAYHKQQLPNFFEDSRMLRSIGVDLLYCWPNYFG